MIVNTPKTFSKPSGASVKNTRILQVNVREHVQRRGPKGPTGRYPSFPVETCWKHVVERLLHKACMLYWSFPATDGNSIHSEKPLKLRILKDDAWLLNGRGEFTRWTSPLWSFRIINSGLALQPDIWRLSTSILTSFLMYLTRLTLAFDIFDIPRWESSIFFDTCFLTFCYMREDLSRQTESRKLSDFGLVPSPGNPG